MRVISFCADGIERAADLGFYSWLDDQDADIVCLQGIEAQEHLLPNEPYFPTAYNPYFFDNQEATNGVAIYCRELPKAIMTGLGFTDFDHEARYIQADFEHISFGSLLAPFASSDDQLSIDRKHQFFYQLHEHLAKIKHKRREFIISGCFYIAHQPRDVQLAEHHHQQLGFTDKERGWLDKMLIDLGYVDAFRAAISDDDEFTWWPDGQRGENGWRVDFQIASEGLRKKVEYGSILTTKQFSNHAPLMVDYDYEINAEDKLPIY